MTQLFSFDTCLRLVHQVALIGFRLVAARGAAPAVGGFLKTDRHGPLRSFEWHAGGNVIGQIAAVHVMTGLAGSPLFITMHMRVMQIDLGVAETGQLGCFGLEHQVFIVTSEAKQIVLQLEISVKRFGKCFHQQPLVRGAMDIVAGGAVTGTNWTV